MLQYLQELKNQSKHCGYKCYNGRFLFGRSIGNYRFQVNVDRDRLDLLGKVVFYLCKVLNADKSLLRASVHPSQFNGCFSVIPFRPTLIEQGGLWRDIVHISLEGSPILESQVWTFWGLPTEEETAQMSVAYTEQRVSAFMWTVQCNSLYYNCLSR